MTENRRIAGLTPICTINGRIVMRDRHLLTLDEAAIKEGARIYREKIIKSLGSSAQ